MSAGWVQLPTDTHEHAAGLADYRELASACIRDAFKCLAFAEVYTIRASDLRDPALRRRNRHIYADVRDRAWAHRQRLEIDVDWFRRPDGFSLWVCATLLDEREAEAVRDEYLRRAESTLDYYDDLYDLVGGRA